MRDHPGTLALVLAGGRVDDLGVLTWHRPKSAVPFGGLYRVIDFALSNLMHSGIDRAAVLSQYRSRSLIEHLGRGEAWDMIGRHRGITLLPPYTAPDRACWYRGTADAVRQNLDFVHSLAPEVVLILSGDHVYRMDYRPMIARHRESGADMTIAFTPVEPGGGGRYGLAALDCGPDRDFGRVLDYREKPEDSPYSWASMTVYCFTPAALGRFVAAAEPSPGRETVEFGRDVIPAMLAAGADVRGYCFRGYWGYTRTVEEYWRTSRDLLGPSPAIDLDEWGVCTNLAPRAVCDRQPLLLGSSARVADSLVHHGCRINGEVVRSILFPGVVVEEGAVVRDSIVFHDCRIGRGAGLWRVIADEDVAVGADARLGRDGGAITLCGWRNRIAAGSVIGAGSVIHPGPGEVAGGYPDGSEIRGEE